MANNKEIENKVTKSSNNKKEVKKSTNNKSIKSETKTTDTKKKNSKTIDLNKETSKKTIEPNKQQNIEKTTSAKPRVKKNEVEVKKEVKVETTPEIVVYDNNKILVVFEKIIILVAVAIVFSIIGFLIGKNNEKRYSDDSKELQLFIEQYNKVINEYYEDVDKTKLIKGAIEGMLSTLDGYSQVIDDSSNNFSITLEGSYQGLGIEIVNDINGDIIIQSVYKNSPAFNAGLKIGDTIIKINDTDLRNVSTTDFVDLVSKTEDIKLVVIREKKELTFDLKKDYIVIESVSSKMLNDKTGYIKVDIFANNTYEQFKTQLDELEDSGMKSLIVDLRNNTGGHLSAVTDMLSLFLDNSNVIYQTQSKTETLKYYSEGNETKKYKIVILQNEISASASEIMAATLKEQLNAYVIGKTSFGKGTVQQLETVDGLGQYKFTTKKWLTPNGVWLNETGLTPDLDITQSEEYYKNPTDKNDTQLQAAIKYLK